ncbi:MAG: hypothetical protein ACR2RB_20310 [Gammaproteobacteria bacterium]
MSQSDLHTLLMLAERHDNPAGSVTHHYERYAQQLCESLALDPGRVIFLELGREPAIAQADRSSDSETIALHRVWPLFQSGADHTRWCPVDDGLRETIIRSLTTQHALTDATRTIAPSEVPGSQRVPFP